MESAKEAPVIREFSTGANRDVVEDKLDFRGFVSPKALRRFSAYMNKNRKLPDGSLRSSDNWKKGIPIPVYNESLIRHAVEFWESLEEGDILACDEAACGIFFNVMGYLHERVKLMDEKDEIYPGKRVPGKPPITYPNAKKMIEDASAKIAA